MKNAVSRSLEDSILSQSETIMLDEVLSGQAGPKRLWPKAVLECRSMTGNAVTVCRYSCFSNLSVLLLIPEVMYCT